MSTSSSRLIHGFLEPCLLSLLHQQPDYGLGLAQRLESAGLGPVPGGTLYPALLRLEKQGLVAVSWGPSEAGPARKYFTPTPEGSAELAARREEWKAFTTVVGAIINDTGPAGGSRPAPRGAPARKQASP